jgi:hypothetical protein
VAVEVDVDEVRRDSVLVRKSPLMKGGIGGR